MNGMRCRGAETVLRDGSCRRGGDFARVTHIVFYSFGRSSSRRAISSV